MGTGCAAGTLSASALSGHITGQTPEIDGGQLIA